LATAHPELPQEQFTPPAQDICSSTSESPLAPPFSNSFLIFRDYFFLDHPASFVIDRMSDIFVGPVFALFARHRHKVPRGAAYDFEVSNHEAVIQRDSYVSPELLFIHRKDPNLCNLHRDPLRRKPVALLAVDLTGFFFATSLTQNAH